MQIWLQAYKLVPAIISGQLNELPERAYYLVGNIDEAVSKAESLKS